MVVSADVEEGQKGERSDQCGRAETRTRLADIGYEVEMRQHHTLG